MICVNDDCPVILTVRLGILLTVRDNVLFDSDLMASPPSRKFDLGGKLLTAARHRSLFNYLLNKFLSSTFCFTGVLATVVSGSELKLVLRARI